VTAQRVLLWRHGRTAFNHESRFQGQRDVGLDQVGVEQARRAARLLARQIAAFPPGPVRLLSSDLSRAWDTAQPLSELLGVLAEPDQRLREVHAGVWEGLTRDEIVAGWPEDHAAWRRGDDVPVGGGETRSQAAARGAACIMEAADAMDGGTLICASHGGTLRGSMFLLLGWPAVSWNAIEGLRNAHWAQLDRLAGDWRLAAYNLGGDLGEGLGEGLREGLGEGLGEGRAGQPAEADGQHAPEGLPAPAP
jgi:probable phosphoglycerate mutase